MKSSKWSLRFLQWQIMDNLDGMWTRRCTIRTSLQGRMYLLIRVSKDFALVEACFHWAITQLVALKSFILKPLIAKSNIYRMTTFCFMADFFFYKQTPPRLYYTSKHLSQMIDAISSNKTSYPEANFFFWYQARF